jgi:hypothetical protein
MKLSHLLYKTKDAELKYDMRNTLLAGVCFNNSREFFMTGLGFTLFYKKSIKIRRNQ